MQYSPEVQNAALALAKATIEYYKAMQTNDNPHAYYDMCMAQNNLAQICKAIAENSQGE